MSPGPVVVVGDVLADVVVHPHGPVVRGDDTPSSVRVRLGGAACSVARGIRAHGAPARLVGRVGDDPMAAAIRAALDDEGVEHRLAVDPVHPTGTVVALVRDGDRDMLTDRGASAHLTPADLPPGWLDGAGHLHVSGYVLLGEGTRDAGRAAVAAAAQASVRLSVDPASAGMLAALGPARFLGLLPGPTLLTPNRTELAALVGSVAADLPAVLEAARRLAVEVGEVAVTLGPDGVAWTDGREGLHVPVDAVGPVDPLGAGDALVAGLLVARLAGQDVEAQLRAGIHAALARQTA